MGAACGCPVPMVSEVAGEGVWPRTRSARSVEVRVDGARSRPGRCSVCESPTQRNPKCCRPRTPNPRCRIPDAGLDLDVWPSSLRRCLAEPREKESGPNDGDGYKTDSGTSSCTGRPRRGRRRATEGAATGRSGSARINSGRPSLQTNDLQQRRRRSRYH